MKKRVKVKAIVIAEVWIHEDALGNQEIEDIQDTLEFEVID